MFITITSIRNIYKSYQFNISNLKPIKKNSIVKKKKILVGASSRKSTTLIIVDWLSFKLFLLKYKKYVISKDLIIKN